MLPRVYSYAVYIISTTLPRALPCLSHYSTSPVPFCAASPDCSSGFLGSVHFCSLELWRCARAGSETAGAIATEPVTTTIALAT
eukprot:3402656-Pyramimonas_sp.AAC.1